jgi:hypothetical protein
MSYIGILPRSIRFTYMVLIAIEYRSRNGDKKEGKMRGFSNYYNPYRSARMGIFGTCFIGPVFHRWFNVLERVCYCVCR